MAATLIDPSIPVLSAAGCGHDFGCIAGQFSTLLSQRQGPACPDPLIINQNDFSDPYEFTLPAFLNPAYSQGANTSNFYEPTRIFQEDMKMSRQHFYHTEKGIRDAVFSFLMQQLIAVLVCPLLLTFYVLFTNFVPFLNKLLEDPGVIAIPYLLCAGGFFFGYRFPRYMEYGYSCAVWTWILPVLLVTYSSFVGPGQAGTRESILQFLGVKPDNHNLEEGLSLVFLIVPTWSSIAYSLGALIKLKKGVGKTGPGKSGPGTPLLNL